MKKLPHFLIIIVSVSLAIFGIYNLHTNYLFYPSQTYIIFAITGIFCAIKLASILKKKKEPEEQPDNFQTIFFQALISNFFINLLGPGLLLIAGFSTDDPSASLIFFYTIYYIVLLLTAASLFLIINLSFNFFKELNHK